MSKYPRSIRYALSTYSNNIKKDKYKTESHRLHSQENHLRNSLSNDNISKISENIYSNPYENLIKNKYTYNINSEMDDVKNKTEARQLIEQTKKMMEEYSLNKLKKQNGFKNILNSKNSKIDVHNQKQNTNLKNFKNKSTSNFDLHLNFNAGNNLENNNFNNNTNKKSSILNKDYLDQLASKPDSIDVLTQKLIY